MLCVSPQNYISTTDSSHISSEGFSIATLYPLLPGQACDHSPRTSILSLILEASTKIHNGPTENFEIPQPQNPPINVSEVQTVLRSTDLEALKL